MQGNGAEMLRLACCLATEQGVSVCAPVHDAILIKAPLEQLDEAVSITERAMAQASAIVLKGPELRIETKLIRYPERYQNDRGAKMWNTVWTTIKDISGYELEDAPTDLGVESKDVALPVHVCCIDEHPSNLFSL